METKSSLFKNTIYKSLLSLVNIVVPLIIGPYIMRLLDTELYGIYNKVFANYQIFFVFASFGVYTLGVREISRIRNDENKISKLFTNLFFISLLSNVLVLTIYIIFSFISSQGITRLLYLIMAIQIVANVFYVEFVNEAIENYKFITIKSVIVKIGYFIAVLLWVRKPDDVIAYALIVSFVNFANNIISFIYAKKRIKFDFSEIRFKEYIKPLVAVLIITNIDLLYSQLDRVMLGNFVSNISVTEYYIAYYLISTLSSIPYAIINVSIPRLSYLLKNEGKKTYEEKLNNSISSLLFIILPMCFGVFVMAKEAVQIYSGDKYPGLEVPLMIACIGRIILSMQSVMDHLVMYPNDREDRILRLSFIGGVCNLLFN
ncbi:MAG: oligosaccharide flippase family protein, partial [Erysipelotrichia bacterium]|nr:oligosaccharide flippase family protein [Erysipelotrichia bacterium]